MTDFDTNSDHDGCKSPFLVVPSSGINEEVDCSIEGGLKFFWKSFYPIEDDYSRVLEKLKVLKGIQEKISDKKNHSSIKRHMEMQIACLDEVKELLKSMREKLFELRRDNYVNQMHPGCEENSMTVDIRMNQTKALMIRIQTLKGKFETTIYERFIRDNRKNIRNQIFDIAEKTVSEEEIDALVKEGRSETVNGFDIHPKRMEAYSRLLIEIFQRCETTSKLKGKLDDIQNIIKLFFDELADEEEIKNKAKRYITLKNMAIVEYPNNKFLRSNYIVEVVFAVIMSIVILVTVYLNSLYG